MAQSGIGSLAPYKVPYQTVSLPSGLEVAQVQLNRNFEEVMRRAQDAKRHETYAGQLDAVAYPPGPATPLLAPAAVPVALPFRLRSQNSRLRLRYGGSFYLTGGVSPVRIDFDFVRPDTTATALFQGLGFFKNTAADHFGYTGLVNLGDLTSAQTFAVLAAGPPGDWTCRVYVTVGGPGTANTDANDYFWLDIAEEWDTDDDAYIT